MGKAARRALKRKMEHLSELSFRSHGEFDAAWEKRVDSWLDEIGDRAREWGKGDIEKWRVLFDIPDRADVIMRACSPAAQRRHRAATFALLEGECSRQVAQMVDRRLCRTNAMSPEWLEMKRYYPKS